MAPPVGRQSCVTSAPPQACPRRSSELRSRLLPVIPGPPALAHRPGGGAALSMNICRATTLPPRGAKSPGSWSLPHESPRAAAVSRRPHGVRARGLPRRRPLGTLSATSSGPLLARRTKPRCGAAPAPGGPESPCRGLPQGPKINAHRRLLLDRRGQSGRVCDCVSFALTTASVHVGTCRRDHRLPRASPSATPSATPEPFWADAKSANRW